jgi:CheY-like chemotaxis protein
MSRILLADDSPHAQRMGERILRDEGFEVVTVTDGESAIIRLADFDPDLIVADAFIPQKSGYEICQFVRNDPRFRHTRIVLTAGAMEALDEEEARRAGVDATLKKPFEASVVLEAIKPLLVAARAARAAVGVMDVPVVAGNEQPSVQPAPLSETVPAIAPEVDPERIRAAVTLALDAAMPAMIDEITERVLVALGQ